MQVMKFNHSKLSVSIAISFSVVCFLANNRVWQNILSFY